MRERGRCLAVPLLQDFPTLLVFVLCARPLLYGTDEAPTRAPRNPVRAYIVDTAMLQCRR